MVGGVGHQDLFIASHTLKEFWQKHRTAEQPLKSWYREAVQSDWDSLADIKRRYGHASFIKGNRVVFNIGGNKHRLIVLANYDFRIFYIRFRMEQLGLERKDLEPLIGSHARVSEVLNKRRGLSLKMIRALHEELDIPLEALIGRDA